jgi:hypothetical protein
VSPNMPKIDSELENGMIIGSGTGKCITPTPTGGFANVLQQTTNVITEFDLAATV